MVINQCPPRDANKCHGCTSLRATQCNLEHLDASNQQAGLLISNTSENSLNREVMAVHGRLDPAQAKQITN